MSAQFEIPFAIGEEVWQARLQREKIRQTCSECAGTKAITLIKGNGEQVSLACENCRVAYEPSSGMETIHLWVVAPQKFICEKIHIYGDEIRYSDKQNYSDIKCLFSDFDECTKKCNELLAKQTKEAEENQIRCLSSKKQHMAYSATYWTQKVNKLKKELKTAEDRLLVCKTRVKEDKKNEQE